MNPVERLKAVRGAGIRIIAHLPADAADEELQTFSAEALQSGYVAVEAHKDLPDDERRRIWHRHVALIHRGDASAISVRWVRELASASPRAHAVLVVTGQPDRVHDGPVSQAPLLDLAGSKDPASEERVLGRNELAARGKRLWMRRRVASARRWATAAVERARRLNDEVGVALAFAQLLEYSDARTEAEAAPLIARGRRLLSSLDELSARSHVVAGLAELWITIGEFEAATAALAAVDVECELTGIAVPPWIRAPQCELACWQGCWDQAELRARQSGHLGWRVLVAFARQDWATVHMLEPIASQPDAEEETGPASGPSRWRDVLVLERLRMAGSDDEASEWIRKADPRQRGRAEQLLWQWCTKGFGTARTAALDAEIRRLGAEGIRRWGLRRQDMHMWAGVSSLLTQVHEADDAATAMRRACQWAREYTGVDAVGIVSADGAMIACHPEGIRQVGPGAPGPAEALRYGGVRIGDVVLQGIARDQSEARVVARALATACAPALRARLDELQVSRAGETLAGELLGISPAMRALRDAVARAAGSSFPVLIEGESGTGKELVARALHRLSARRDRRWAAVNCAALTDELLEAELFGHVRGAFTGAVGPRVGLLEDAHEGTLFLDEVAELSPRAQAKLLRVLQEGEIRRLGENVSRRVDVRLVTATNRSLTDAARQGAYREDLIFRLAVIRLRVPPLRDRIEDVPLLAQHFWRTMAARVPTRALLGPDAIAALCRATWPGNVRELQNVIAALAVGGPSGGRIRARQVDAILADRSHRDDLSPPMSLATARQQCDRRIVAASLARHANQRAAAARELGVSRQGLAKLIARLKLDETTYHRP